MLRVELGPKEVSERSCILARCYTAGARSPRRCLLLPPLLLRLRLPAQMRAVLAHGHAVVWAGTAGSALPG